MKLDVTSLRSVPGKQVQNSVEIDLNKIVVQGNQLTLPEPVQLDYVASNKGNGIAISGNINALIEYKCGRCLEKTAIPLAVPFSELFFHDSQVEQSKEEPLMDEVHIFSGNEINLAEIVEQNIIINLPLRVVCGEDCKGFCAGCGTNLNFAQCSCVNDEVDPRLAVLQKLLNSSNSPKEVEK